MNSGTVMNDSRRSLTFSLYILYILAIFTAGLLAVVALVINYVKQDQMSGGIYESHFTWQIRTFWWYLIWNIVAFIPFIFLLFTDNNADAFASVLLLASGFCVGVIGLAWLWIVYRAIKGLLRLNENKAMYE